MEPSKPVIFFGTEQFSVPSLRALISAGYPILAAVTKPDSPKGRGRQMSPPAVKVLATEYNIPVLQPVSLDDTFLKDIEVLIQASNSDSVIGVLVAYGKIVPEQIIMLFTPGIINVHPSLLPKYRGPSPIESAILYGDTETGVSIMSLSKEMDAGPVYAQVTITLDGTETRPTLYDTLAERGAQLLIDTLPTIIAGELLPTPQDPEHISYCSLLAKKDGFIDPNTKTAQDIERQVRAYDGFPKSRLTLVDTECIVLAASQVESATTAPLTITCKDDTFLSIERLIAPSGKTMSADAYLRGLHSSR